ncbi:MAG: hypothetical protein H0X66_13070 [Verrucomicrobia bacterium]|nr:hypothetical protein [Verrucomicrobiota bacterium]
MKNIIRYVAVALISGALTVSTAFAGECCKKAADQTKKGETCAKCLSDAPACCKKAAKEAGKDKDAKPCAKCAAKKEKAKA